MAEEMSNGDDQKLEKTPQGETKRGQKSPFP